MTRAKEVNVLRKGYVFLSPQWVQEASRVIQSAKRTDEYLGKLASRLNLGLTYIITDLPKELSEAIGESKMVIFIRLKKGAVQVLEIGTTVPEGEKVDFTIASSYRQAKSIFLGEINPANAFVRRQIQVMPLREVYRRPRFTAECIVGGNQMIQIIQTIPTIFQSNSTDSSDNRCIACRTT